MEGQGMLLSKEQGRGGNEGLTADSLSSKGFEERMQREWVDFPASQRTSIPLRCIHLPASHHHRCNLWQVKCTCNGAQVLLQARLPAFAGPV